MRLIKEDTWSLDSSSRIVETAKPKKLQLCWSHIHCITMMRYLKWTLLIIQAPR